MNVETKKKLSLPWIVVGVLTLALIAGGIYVYLDLKQEKAAVQARAAMRNPAVQAAMGLMRLQRDPKLALTAEQKAKLIPVLQDLINTKNPSQEFLKQKAGLITGALTDEQQNLVNSARQNMPQGGQGQRSQGGQGGWNGQSNQGGLTQQGRTGQVSMQPQAIYEQVLKSLQN